MILSWVAGTDLDACNEWWKVRHAHAQEMIEVTQQLLDDGFFLSRTFRFVYLVKDSSKQSAEKLLGKRWVFL